MAVTLRSEVADIKSIKGSSMAVTPESALRKSKSVEFERAALVPRTIHAAARALCKLFPHWEVGHSTVTIERDSSDENMDAFVIVETILEIEHNDSIYMLSEMESLVPFSPDAPFRHSLATFIVNLCMLKAGVKSQDMIPTEVLYRMVNRLNRLLHCRGHVDTILVDCEHLLARAQDIALGA